VTIVTDAPERAAPRSTFRHRYFHEQIWDFLDALQNQAVVTMIAIPVALTAI
jgi:hypothetical protein